MLIPGNIGKCLWVESSLASPSSSSGLSFIDKFPSKYYQALEKLVSSFPMYVLGLGSRLTLQQNRRYLIGYGHLCAKPVHSVFDPTPTS